jgi:hypothetical protein
MKTILSLLAVIALASSALAVNPLPPDTKFQGKNNTLPSGATLTFQSGSTVTIANGASAVGLVRKIDLGTPILAAVNTIVTSANCKVTAHTLVGAVSGVKTLDVPRNVTVTVTDAGTHDVAHAYVITGTDSSDAALTETITSSTSTTTVAGTKIFKTVSRVISAGWVINAASTSTADTVTVGVGNLIGTKVVLPDATGTTLTTLGTTVAASATTGGSLATSSVNASGGTYDGSKRLYIYVDR